MKKTANSSKRGRAQQEPRNNGDKKKPDFEPPPRGASGGAASSGEEEFGYEDVDLDNLDSVTDDLDADDGIDKFPIAVLEAFPSLLQPIQDWKRQLGMPSLLPVVCAILVLSMALGRGLRARNNKGGTYPNLFALLGADSGTGKTLVFDAAMQPLIELQKELTEEFNQAASMLKAELLLVKKEIEAIAFLFSKLKKGGKKLTPEEEAKNKERLAALHQEQEKIENKLAKPPAIWTSDFTAEALANRLANSNELLSVASDEGGIAVQCMEGRYSAGDDSDDMLLCKMFSVNSHIQDRIGRGRITLAEPCGALLLLVQPDILTRAFSNTRLVIGGFLARCLCADTKLEVQYEDENAEVTAFDTEISASWSKLIKETYRKYHNAGQPYDLRINPGVHRLSCRMHNWVVARVRGDCLMYEALLRAGGRLPGNWPLCCMRHCMEPKASTTNWKNAPSRRLRRSSAFLPACNLRCWQRCGWARLRKRICACKRYFSAAAQSPSPCGTLPRVIKSYAKMFLPV